MWIVEIKTGSDLAGELGPLKFISSLTGVAMDQIINVLYGLEEYLSIVKEGIIEAANKPDILYQGQNTTEECVEFLKANNFDICGIYSNDHHDHESNIHFKYKI